MEKVIVVGGSVAGGFTAYKLAKNFDVEIIEEHSHFKKTCSGILTDPINNLIDIRPSIIENKIKKFRIYAPNNDFLELKFKKPDIIFNREKLNEYIVDIAVKDGAKLRQNTKFIKTQRGKVLLKSDNKEFSVNTNYLIGADGSLSAVAKSVDLFLHRNFFLAAKSIIKMENDNTIEVYPHFGCFSWVVPRTEDEVEVGTMSHYTDSQAFTRFLQKFNNQILSKEASIIPIYSPKIKTYKKFNNISTYLIGDSATMAKATTGGSIMQSLTAAKILADCIINNEDYEKKWRAAIGNQLYLHLKIRKALDKFKAEDWNELIKLLKDEKIKQILETKSRDNPYFIFKMMFLKPSLIKFSKVFLRNRNFF
ncbi:NAD(P)/FAD-dependent oxidoreductase [Candidatus Woesearchaeota archaeon]|nr:NAD(P)/FAD-dependent oxidoreductase [Candidatus Woesearchaeota archaeon]